MQRLTMVLDGNGAAEAIERDLGGIFQIKLLPVALLADAPEGQPVLLDVNLGNRAIVQEIKGSLSRRLRNSGIVFAVDKTSRAEKIQAYALGATDIVHRPVSGRALLKVLLGDFDALSLDTSSPELRSIPVVGATLAALENIFSSACLGAPIALGTLQTATEELVKCIQGQGLGLWIETVRRHHSRTYQHSLIVTGVAVAFGQNLGFSSRDRELLSFGGMLHDIGKARIPVSILEKPGPLDDAEMAIMRRHPEYGFDALASVPTISSNMLDIVLHHHEYLDGSGYPNGLKAPEISDLVRIMTISDIFGALIERRSYRPPMRSDEAYEMLVKLGPKLDVELVREFQFAADLTITSPQYVPHEFSARNI